MSFIRQQWDKELSNEVAKNMTTNNSQIGGHNLGG